MSEGEDDVSDSAVSGMAMEPMVASQLLQGLWLEEEWWRSGW